MFQELIIQVHSCGGAYLEKQPGIRNTTPYWRLHWNASSGSTITFNRRKLTLSGDKIALIPSGVEIDRHIRIPTKHFSSHFTLFNQKRKSPLKIYIFQLDREKTEELMELCKISAGKTWDYWGIIKLNAFILSFLSKIPHHDWGKKDGDPRISRILSIMTKTPALPHSNEKLAKEIGMSTNAFIRFFKRHVGSAPLAYQIKLRTEKAMILLEHTEKSIEEIAEECGFCDRNYFSKTFKEQTGTPPAQYRKQTIE